MLGFCEESNTILTTLTDEMIGSSEIEGVFLIPTSVRSSIVRKFGMEVDVTYLLI